MRLLFLPRRLQRVQILIWLKRVHAWTGLWGALIFLMLGFSGILLNHRSVMKIDTAAPVEVSEVAIPVDPGVIGDEKMLGQWAQRRFALTSKAIFPQGEKSDERIRFLGQNVAAAQVWKASFNHPDARLTVSYLPGASAVMVKKEGNGVLQIVKNLHKGTGLGIGWVLFLDSIAGALIAMSVTGFLLWSRLHGPRLAAGGLVAVSLAGAVISAWPAFIGS